MIIKNFYWVCILCFFLFCNSAIAKSLIPDIKTSNKSLKITNLEQKNTSFSINQPIYSSGHIEVYFLNPFNSNNQKTNASLRLLELINNSKNKIYFAVYGISNPIIQNALIKQYNNGLDIRWVTDVNKYGENNYKGTNDFKKHIPKFRTDATSEELKFFSTQQVEYKIKNQNIKTIYNDSNIEHFTDQLMHNKFFIFDNDYIATGSTNISTTGISGKYINANDFIVIKSPIINQLYLKEFEQMYNGNFHKNKKHIYNKKNIILEDGSVISIYFSPKDFSFITDVLKIINESEKFVYVPMFYLTDKKIPQALINAKERGVDVKIIIDATSAKSNYSKHKILRIAGIPVKVENWVGKMHMKSLVTEKYVVTGSSNWTSRALNYNDENTLIIKNPKIVELYKIHFLELFNSIPDKWLSNDPKAEGADSPNSCSDKNDNDHDGYLDMSDKDCSPDAPQGKMYDAYYGQLK